MIPGTSCIAAKGTPPAPADTRRDLKKPPLRPMVAFPGELPFMLRRLLLISSLIAMGLALDGCTKCGPIWDDWTQSPKSCRSDRA
jgi:hypothetical protein